MKSNIIKLNCAIYQITDVMSYTDIELARKAIQLFGFVNIILDRNNIPLSDRKYRLSYTDRMEIIKNEMIENNITDYQVIPSDISFQDTVKKYEITDVIMDFYAEEETNFKLMKRIQKFTDIRPILIKTSSTSDYEYAEDLFKNDSSMRLYNRECSQYGFSKFKIKNTKKVGIISNGNKKREKILCDIIKDRGYDILDLDSMKNVNPQKEVANKILNSFDKTIIVKYKNMKKDKLDGVFSAIITMENEDALIEGKQNVELNEILVNGKNDQDFKNRTIDIINSKIKLRNLCK